ncbi:BON domain-containing protein [Telluria beijingensis]|uniref:BON domain-containing protein n=1 Tax=Telluria beijingensis TaxID=3068633 RepID=UPI002795C825|nr:BON domain-containing protein [Massilia sp. REN29]
MNGSSIKRFGSIPVLLALLAGGPLAGCASGIPGFGTVATVDDAAISAGVRNAIRHDPELTVSDLDVDTYQGIVRLSGFVSSADSVAAAASVARTVKGVKSVRNDLRLK